MHSLRGTNIWAGVCQPIPLRTSGDEEIYLTCSLRGVVDVENMNRPIGCERAEEFSLTGQPAAENFWYEVPAHESFGVINILSLPVTFMAM